MKTLSLRRGLLLRLGVLMLVFATLASVVVYRMALRYADEAYDEWLLDSARSLSQLVQWRQGHVVVDLPGPTLQAFVFDAHDRVLFRIDDQQDGLIAGQTLLRAPALGPHDINYMDLNVDGQPMRAVQVLLHDLHPGASVSIVVAETMHKRARLASRVLITVMVASGVLGLLTIWLIRDAVTRGLRPLLRLADAVRQRPHGGLTRLPDAGVAAELRIFTGAINELLGQLEQAVKLQRRFIADAAHQLRTPLAALKVELEHATREPDPTLHQQALARLHMSLDRLSRITHQLLTLARAEPGALASSSFAPIDLYALAQQAAVRFAPRFLAAQIDLGFEGEAHPVVRGDPLLLEELLNNVLDNALRYVGPGAEVTLLVGFDGVQATLIVQDNGPGVPADEVPKLAVRFHRPAGSAPGGSGLGLAIVKEIAQLHGGHVAISPRTPHGLSVCITLPALEQQANRQELS